MELEKLFEEVQPFIKPDSIKGATYGRGKDYDLAAIQADIAEGFRICTKCNIRKGIFEFSKRTAHVTGYKAWCKACDSEAFNKHRYKNLERSRERERVSHYKSTYKLEPELAAALAMAANRIGKCPICHDTETLVLDHDHHTNKVRDLICSQCNALLGNARDNLNILYEAIAYLKKHKGV